MSEAIYSHFIEAGIINNSDHGAGVNLHAQICSPSNMKVFILSHNNPGFKCNIAITNFRVSHTCEIRLHDVIGQSTVPMYS